jgi:hypothetical protein
MSSRGMIAAHQRVNAYRPDGQVAPHVFVETVYIDSSESVLEINGSFWVASKKFIGRYYRVTNEQGQWATSSYSDEKFARKLVATVQAYISSKAGAVC